MTGVYLTSTFEKNRCAAPLFVGIGVLVISLIFFTVAFTSSLSIDPKFVPPFYSDWFLIAGSSTLFLMPWLIIVALINTFRTPSTEG